MRTWAIFEPLVMFGLILAYIWKLRFTHPRFWVLLLAGMLLSHLVRRETPRRLGFGVINLRALLHELAPLLLLIVLAILTAGLLFRTAGQIGFEAAIAAAVVYLPWGIVQQYALNGYFLNRLQEAMPARPASIAAALLFCLAHAPNPFLMLVTFPLGWCATALYRRSRNLYLLGIAHAAIGLLLVLMVPPSVSHHLRVGPRWFQK